MTRFSLSWLWHVPLLVAISCLAGCATSGYWGDRARDCADIITITSGQGSGVKLRAGIAQVGLLATHDVVGLRGGAWMQAGGKGNVIEDHLYDNDYLLLPLFSFGDEAFYPKWPFVEGRHKEYDSWKPLPFLTLPMSDCVSFYDRGQFAHYVQCEVVIGCVRTIRMGVNPFEFLDFVLGWLRIDLCDDDVGTVQWYRYAPAEGTPRDNALR